MRGTPSPGPPAIVAPCCRLCAQDHIFRSAVEPRHPDAKRSGSKCALDGTLSRRASDLVILFELSQPKLPNFILTTKEAAAKPPKLCSCRSCEGRRSIRAPEEGLSYGTPIQDRGCGETAWNRRRVATMVKTT